MSDTRLRNNGATVPIGLVYLALISVVLSWIPLVWIARARAVRSDRQRVHVFLDMDQQPKYKAQAVAAIFQDHRAMRVPVPGTIARGFLQEDDHYDRGYETDASGQPVMIKQRRGDQELDVKKYIPGLPPQVTKDMSLLLEGRKQYDIFCAACHGHAGYGDGLVTRRVTMLNETAAGLGRPLPAADFGIPRDLNPDPIKDPTNRAAVLAEGELFDVITNGVGKMRGYKALLTTDERWAVVAYVKALQFSQRVALEQLPAPMRQTVAALPLEKPVAAVAPTPAPPVAPPAPAPVAPKPPDQAAAGDAALIAKGKNLFQTKICFTCHQVDPNVPSPAGEALKATKFIGKFWGVEREVHDGVGGPIIKVKMDEAYFLESVLEPMKKIVKGSIPGMAPLPTTEDERQALMAYVKSLSK